MKLILIRHGKTQHNIDEKFCGSTDAEVCEIGVEELLKLKETIKYPKAERFFTSGMKRTNKTLEVLYGIENPEVLEQFKEMNFGDFENVTFKQLESDERFVEWSKDTFNQRCPGGESGKDMLERLVTGIEKLKHTKEKSIVVVSHGAVIATAMQYLFRDIEISFQQLIPDNGRGYIIDLDKKEYTTL